MHVGTHAAMKRQVRDNREFIADVLPVDALFARHAQEVEDTVGPCGNAAKLEAYLLCSYRVCEWRDWRARIADA